MKDCFVFVLFANLDNFLKELTKMADTTDDVDDEYLDDPISLMAIDVKEEVLDPDDIIDIQSSDEEETYTSSYGKKNFVLPVTFFDNIRNIRLLNKCKPMCISIVDCQQHPTYYTKIREKENSKFNDSSVEIDNKAKSGSEHKPNKEDAQNVINTSVTIHETDKKKEGENKRRVHDLYYKRGQKNDIKSDDSVEIDDKHRSNSEHVTNSIDAQNTVNNTSIIIHEDDKKKKAEKKSSVPDVYNKSEEENNRKSDDSSVEIDDKHRSTSEHEPNSVDAQNAKNNTSITINGAGKKKKGERKRRGESYYETLKRRKENSKQVALNCKDLSQVDFKRNTGLVGLKITDTIFNQIVNTEKALVRAKKSAENKSKESNENGLEKTLITNRNDVHEEKCKETFSAAEKALSVVIRAETKSKEKGPDTIKSIISTNDKETSESVVERSLTKIDLVTHVENTRISVKESSTEKSKNNLYMEEVGAALDNLGTTIIPVTDTHTNNVASNNMTATDNIENKSIKTHTNSATIINKGRNSNGVEVRCSLKIPSKKIVERVLKLKEVKSINKHVLDVLNNTNVQQSPKETVTKSHTVSKCNIKPSKPKNDDLCVVSEKHKTQYKSMDVAESRETKQADKPTNLPKNANSNGQPGSNSPVIPCTTITIRPVPPKSTENMSSPKNSSQSVKKDNATVHITQSKIQNNSLTPINIVEPKSNKDAQKPSLLPKIATMNEADVSDNSRCTYITHGDPPKQLNIVAQTKVKGLSDSKDTQMCTQNPTANLKILKVTEYKPPNNYSFSARHIKNNISAPNLADPNMSKTNLTKEATQINTPIKSATFPGSNVHINNQTTNGLIKSQTCPNVQMSPSTNPKCYKNNAIIFRRPPPPRYSQNNMPPNQRQPINYRPHLQMPYGSTPMRFRLPSPYPPPPPNYPPSPPNYPSSPPNYSSSPHLMQIRPNQIFSPSRMSPYLRAIEIGLRFPGPRSPGCRTSLQIPHREDNMQMNRPQNHQANKDSFIGNTANGDSIMKINIPPLASVTDTVNDKQMMLAELNNAMMSPELDANKPETNPTNDLKRKADSKLIEPVKPKYSKPCPLSRKTNNSANDLNKEKIPDKFPPNFGYSPPILPIMTYEESFQKYKNDTNIKKGVTNDTQNWTPARVKCTGCITKLDNKKQKIKQTDSGKQDKAKKITFTDYRNRAKDGAHSIDVDKIRKYNECKNVSDDHNQDLGYDSDSTVKM